MTQDTLFEVQTAPVAPPPNGTVPPASVEPCQPCVKCGEPATLRSPSGTMYCKNCGQCKRVEVVTKNGKVVHDMHGNAATKSICTISVEDFVWWERLKMYVCPCVVSFSVVDAKRRKESER